MILIGALLLVAAACWPLPHDPGFVPERPDDAGSGRPDGGRGRPGRSSGGRQGTVEDVADAVALLAVALRGGAGVASALDEVSGLTDGQVSDDLRTVAAAHRWGLPTTAAWQLLDPCWRPVALVWEATEHAGVAPAELLESAAQRVRERERGERETRLHRAGVLLVLPLGGLFLPGFLATTVVPVVVHLLSRSGA